MRVQVMVGMAIIALAACTAFAPGPAVAGKASQIEPYVGSGYAGIHTAWPGRPPLWQTAPWQGRSPTVIRVHDPAGPAIDMDNSRWIDEDRAKRQKQKEQLQEQYPNTAYPSGGYVYMRLPKGQRYPPGGYAYPGLPNGYDYYPGGRFYPYNNAPPGYYRDPATGFYRHMNPQSVSPGGGQQRPANK